MEPPRNNNNIRFIQLNLRRSPQASINLNQLFTSNNIDFALIQEPNTKGLAGDKLPHFNNRLIHVFNGTNPSAAIIINPRLTITAIKTNLPTLAVVRATIDGHQHTIISSYWCRGRGSEAKQKIRLQNDLEQLEEMLAQCPDTSHLIIGTDANAKSPTWYHTSDDCQRGHLMEEYLAYKNLIVANCSEEPTWEDRGKKGWNELTISSPAVNDRLINWRVSQVDSLSDHKILRFELGTREPQQQSTHQHPRYVTSNTTWEKFDQYFLQSNQTIHADINNSTTGDELLWAIDKLDAHIEETCGVGLRKKNPSPKIGITWWTPELEKERAELQRLRRRYQRVVGEKRQLRYETYKAEKRQFGKRIRDAKNRSWQQFCATRDSKDPSQSIFKLIRKLEPQKSPSIPANSTAELEVLNRLNTHFPEDPPDNRLNHLITRRLTSKMPSTKLQDPEFTEEEVQAAIREFAPGKAPGQDGVDARMLRRINQLSPGLLTDMYNRCLRFGVFPDGWKKAIAVMIPKPDSDVPRPISLLRLMGKGLERLLAERLTWRALQYNWISPTQFAFLPERSTYHAMETLVTEINQAFAEREFFVVISLDIKGAYNNAWWPAILAELHRAHERFECPTNLYRLVREFLSNRVVETTYADATESKRLSRGCPQGSVLAPFLWLLALEPLLRILRARHTFHIAYADDLIIGFRGKDTARINKDANEALKMIADWGKDNKLFFNPDKTKAICFHRIREEANTQHTGLNLINLKMGDKIIDFDEELKYLGVVFDEKLTWNNHLKYTNCKILKLMGQLNRCTSAEWGLNYECRWNLYRHAVEPAILYGCPIWGVALKKQTFRNKIQTMQRQFAIKITRCFKTVSTDALLVIANLLPIRSFVSFDSRVAWNPFQGDPTLWIHHSGSAH